jgi:hypothetical protein
MSDRYKLIVGMSMGGIVGVFVCLSLFEGEGLLACAIMGAFSFMASLIPIPLMAERFSPLDDAPYGFWLVMNSILGAMTGSFISLSQFSGKSLLGASAIAAFGWMVCNIINSLLIGAQEHEPA